MKAHTCILSKDVTTPDGWRIEIDVRSDPTPGSFLSLLERLEFRFLSCLVSPVNLTRSTRRPGVAPRVVVSHIRKEQSLSHDPHEQFVFTYRFAIKWQTTQVICRRRSNKRKTSDNDNDNRGGDMARTRLRFLVRGAVLEACDARFVGVGDEWNDAALAPQVQRVAVSFDRRFRLIIPILFVCSSRLRCQFQKVKASLGVLHMWNDCDDDIVTSLKIK